MCVATSGTSRFNFCGLEQIFTSMKGTQSCANLVSKGFVDSSTWNRVIMAKVRALSQVVPDFGVLLKSPDWVEA